MTAPGTAPGQAAYETYWGPCCAPEDVAALAADWRELADFQRANWEAAAQAAIAAAAPAPADSLRSDLEDIVKTWRENAEYRPTDTRDEMSENYAVKCCADTLADILADHPEPQPAPGPDAAMAALREQRDRYWNALFYIAHRAAEYIRYAGPECVDVAREAIGNDEPPVPADDGETGQPGTGDG